MYLEGGKQSVMRVVRNNGTTVGGRAACELCGLKAWPLQGVPCIVIAQDDCLWHVQTRHLPSKLHKPRRWG